MKKSHKRLTVENRPPPSPSNINPIIHNRRQNIIQIPLIIIRPSQIPQDRLQTRELALKRLRKPKLRHLDVRHAREQLFRNLAQELADPRGIVVQPVGAWIRRGAHGKAVGGFVRRADAFGVVGSGGVGCAGLGIGEAVDVVGGIWIDGKKITRTSNHVFFGLGEGREDVGAEGVF
jgi:hypothetical protein